MKAISIQFHALSTLKQIKQDYAAHLSSVTIEGQPEGTVITGVFVDGLPQWIVPSVTPMTVHVRPPLLQQGERIEVRCVIPQEAPQSPAKGSERLAPAYPTTAPSYGLTAPEKRAMRPLP